MSDLKIEIPEMDMMDRMPEKGFDVEEARGCILFDADRQPTRFGDLMDNDSSITIFVFIRHFLDYVTRDYVEDFSKIFPRTLQQKDCKIVLIGCAPARYIRSFVEDTNCPHPIYCDSSRIIHKCLGLHSVAVANPQSRSPHIRTNTFVGFWQTVWRAIHSQTEQGSPFQMGGQLAVSKEGHVLFFHRDKHPLDHTPINDLLAIAGLPRIDFCTKYRIKHV